MSVDSILEIRAYGAWNGGTSVDNSMFENKGMFFKGHKPVTDEAIEGRIGVRRRIAAPEDERISAIAMQDLLDTSDIDPSRIKIVIGATNIGEDQFDPGPLVRFPFELVRQYCPEAIVFDLYGGCPGFNVATELVFMLSINGVLKKDDISVVVGAENIHRARIFRPLDTSNIIFGDDSLAVALETKGNAISAGHYKKSDKVDFSFNEDFIPGIARKILELAGHEKIDGIIVDNQLGKIQYRTPAVCARIQASLVEQMYPGEAGNGALSHFKDVLEFYNQNVNSFAFDIMTLDRDPAVVEKIAKSYVESGKYGAVVSVYLSSGMSGEIVLHKGEGFTFESPEYGVLDTHTRTHGCFGDFIQFTEAEDGVFAEIDGKGVFLHFTRGAKKHFDDFLSGHNLTLYDIDLLVEHQANFAMIPLTLERVLPVPKADIKPAVADYIANRMVTNIHERGNCSVVCMQRLPYDLQRGALAEDMVQGFPVNRNLDELREAKLILYDSTGTGMTRSGLLLRKR